MAPEVCKLQSKQEISQMFYYNYVLEVLKRSSTTAIGGFLGRMEKSNITPNFRPITAHWMAGFPLLCYRSEVETLLGFAIPWLPPW